jgi:hypothetical protein
VTVVTSKAKLTQNIKTMHKRNSSTRFSRTMNYVSALTVLLLLAASAPSLRADDHGENKYLRNMKINAGTVFNFHPGPTFPWPHEVRGVVQVSNLGNCTVQFNVNIDAGTKCKGGHAYCLYGTMTITTLAGDELQAVVTGWGDPDPKDPKQPASMNLLHYDVAITGGTGKLQGARGGGEINGVFYFCGENCFCDSYAGVATWLYEGVLELPRTHKK